MDCSLRQRVSIHPTKPRSSHFPGFQAPPTRVPAPPLDQVASQSTRLLSSPSSCVFFHHLYPLHACLPTRAPPPLSHAHTKRICRHSQTHTHTDACPHACTPSQLRVPTGGTRTHRHTGWLPGPSLSALVSLRPFVVSPAHQLLPPDPGILSQDGEIPDAPCVPGRRSTNVQPPVSGRSAPPGPPPRCGQTRHSKGILGGCVHCWRGAESFVLSPSPPRDRLSSPRLR